MKISNHAWGQMRIRGITRNDIKHCFNNRPQISKAYGDCEKIVGSAISGNAIVVIYDTIKKQVVTTYPL